MPGVVVISRVDALRRKRTTYAGAIRAFILSASQLSGRWVALFVEGQGDIAYYRSRSEVLFDRVRVLPCGGRQGVLSAARALTRSHPAEQPHAIFCIDADYRLAAGQASPSVSGATVIQLPCYSVENLHVTPAAYRRCLTNFFGLSEVSDADELDAMASSYKKEFAAFCEAALVLNAWYWWHVEQDGHSVPAESLDMDILLKSDGFSVTTACNAGHLATAAPGLSAPSQRLSAPSQRELDERCRALTASGLAHSLRGKWLFSRFFKVRLTRLVELVNSKKDYRKAFWRKRKVSFQPSPMSDIACLASLSSIGDTPQVLKDVLLQRASILGPPHE